MVLKGDLMYIDDKTKSSLFGSLLLTLVTVIWGVAFVFQTTAMDHIGPYTMNGCRALLACIFLLPVAFAFDKAKGKKVSFWGTQDKQQIKTLIKGGIWCGIFVTGASTIQQIGLLYTTVGKAGFLTAAYVVFVPVFSVFLGKKIGWSSWFGVIVMLAGMFLLCVKNINDFSEFNKGDALMIICSLFFSAHIMVIDKYTPIADGIRLSCIQFFVCAVVCLTLAFIFENPQMSNILNAWLPICFVGIMSAGVGYTLQIIAQKYVPAHITPLIMSLESVVSLLVGAIFLNEKMTVREIIGCCFIFVAIIVAQTDFAKLFEYFKNKKNKEKQSDN